MIEKITEEWAFKSLPDKLNEEDVCYLLSLSPQTITRLKDDGELKVQDNQILKKDLLDFIERHFIVNIPSFSVEENIEGYLKQHGSFPTVLQEEDLQFLFNEVPESLKTWPGYKAGRIKKEDLEGYLQKYHPEVVLPEEGGK